MQPLALNDDAETRGFAPISRPASCPLLSKPWTRGTELPQCLDFPSSNHHYARTPTAARFADYASAKSETTIPATVENGVPMTMQRVLRPETPSAIADFTAAWYLAEMAGLCSLAHSGSAKSCNIGIAPGDTRLQLDADRWLLFCRRPAPQELAPRVRPVLHFPKPRAMAAAIMSSCASWTTP